MIGDGACMSLDSTWLSLNENRPLTTRYRFPGIILFFMSRGIFSGRPELTQGSGTGIEFVPNRAGVFGRVLRPYRTLPEEFGGVIADETPPVYFFVWCVPYRTLLVDIMS